MTGSKKCAHPACTCMAAEGSRYCSEVCSDEKNMVELACQCHHPGCEGTKLEA